MEDEVERPTAPIGLLLVQGNCLPQTVRSFLQSAQVEEDVDLITEVDEGIKFHVLPSNAVVRAAAAVSSSCLACSQGTFASLWHSAHPASAPLQGSIPVPSLWIDEDEAVEATASLQIVYSLGSGPQACRLPFKPIKLQPLRKGASPPSPAAFKAFITAKAHLQLYRLTHLLFPTLARWDRDLGRGDVVFVGAQQSTSSADQFRALAVDQVRYLVT